MIEPSDEAILAARLAWYHGPQILSPFMAADLAAKLCSLERRWRRHCERCCSGEDGGYVRRRVRAGGTGGGAWEHDPVAEARAEARLRKQIDQWAAQVPGAKVTLEGDPRGAVVLLQLSGEREARPV